MIPLFAKALKSAYRFLANAMPLRIIVQIALIFLLVGSLIVSWSYLSRYINMNNAINVFNAGEYKTALQTFEEKQDYIPVETWKQSFDAGVAYYITNSQDDARAKFNDAKERSAYINSQDISCMIDTNIAFSFEKSGVDLKDKPGTSADGLRRSADLMMQAYMIRQNIARYCQNIDAAEFKINSQLLEIDKTQYTELMQKAFETDGKNAENALAKDESDNDFEKREAELNSSTTTKVVPDPKLKQLIDDNDKAQIDYQNAQNFKNKNNTQTATPW